MEEIIHLYDQHLTTPFPDRRGEAISGVDLVLIDSDTAGLVDKYIRSRGHLGAADIRILNHCYPDLKTVVKELSGDDHQYFARLQNIVGSVGHFYFEYTCFSNHVEWVRALYLSLKILLLPQGL